MEAARIAGSQAKLAAMCGKKQGHFSKWIRSPLGVPAEYCPDIERGTGVSCERLRPDLADKWLYLRERGQQVSALGGVTRAAQPTKEGI
ncbi:YdaS family helix-turn-helix protein [Paraburkholderia sp. BR14263]